MFLFQNACLVTPRGIDLITAATRAPLEDTPILVISLIIVIPVQLEQPQKQKVNHRKMPVVS